jgi:hypothetical protein
MLRGKRVAVVLVASSVIAAAAFVGGVAAAEDASVTAEPADPGATAAHTVTVTVGEASAGTWSGLAVNYTGSGTDASNVTRDSLQRIGIDEGDDQSGDALHREVGMGVESVTTSEDGAVLTVELDGSASIDAGDELVLVYDDVTNPMAGEWDVGLEVNPGSSGGTATATLTTGSGSMDDGSMSGNETMGNESMDDESMTPTPTMSGDESMNNESMDDGSMTPTPTDGGAGAGTPSETSMAGSSGDDGGGEASPSPTESGGQAGFGVVVVAVGLLVGALVARRRTRS